MSLSDIRTYYDELVAIKKELDIDKYDSDELEELYSNFGGDDFTVNLDGGEYRFIAESAIELIFAESIQDMIEGCYGVGSLPGIISCHIDWDGIVSDCTVDGYGHHFSGYDGSEYNAGGYYIFRVN